MTTCDRALKPAVDRRSPLVDALNVALIAGTCVLSHIFPYQLLILSYAVLGPAHYLTQVSWLHDRRYFSGTSMLLPVMVCITVFFGLPAFAPSLMHPWFSAMLLGVAASIALMLTVPRTPGSLGLAIATAAGLVAGATAFPRVALLVSVLLPTVAHVFVFTASFMLVGALRTGSRAAYLSVIAFLAGAASFLIPVTPLSYAALVPPGTQIGAGLSFFEPIVESLKSMGLSSSTDKHLFGFLSFAYTYHYLNWFSKVKVIQWNRIPRTRGRVIAAIYAVTIALYAYSFTAGFLVSALLSNLHVLLEFPLNLRTFGTLLRQGGRLKIGLSTKAP